MTKIISKRFSLNGWKFIEFLKGNIRSIKEIAKVVVPGLIGWVITQNPALTGVATILGKALLDIIEYYVKQY